MKEIEINNSLFEIQELAEDYLHIKFCKQNIQFSEDIYLFDDDFYARIKNKSLLITGRGPVELYSYISYWCVKKGCKSIIIRDMSLGKDFEIYDRDKKTEERVPEWLNIEQKDEFSVWQIITSKQNDGKWSEAIISSSCFYFNLKNSAETVILTGKGMLLFYSCLACSAAANGYDNVFVNKPTEKALIKINGNIFPNYKKSDKNGRMIGILGDPNSGKSVFSRTFGALMDLYLESKEVWVYDCDAAALTSDWYIYGLQQAGSKRVEEEYKNARSSIKQKWTTELEFEVSENMKKVKANLTYVIADLPGGYHKDEENIHRRIPDSGRAEMLKNCDSFIIIGRKDSPEVFGDWKKALAQYNLDDRIIAEITSVNHENFPAVLEKNVDENGIIKISLDGLDRSHARNDLIEAYKKAFENLIMKIKEEK